MEQTVSPQLIARVPDPLGRLGAQPFEARRLERRSLRVSGVRSPENHRAPLPPYEGRDEKVAPHPSTQMERPAPAGLSMLLDPGSLSLPVLVAAPGLVRTHQCRMRFRVPFRARAMCCRCNATLLRAGEEKDSLGAVSPVQRGRAVRPRVIEITRGAGSAVRAFSCDRTRIWAACRAAATGCAAPSSGGRHALRRSDCRGQVTPCGDTATPCPGHLLDCDCKRSPARAMHVLPARAVSS
jgi:hypothetical protein